MSRVIKNDHPWSQEEIDYQLARGRKYEVEQNEKDWPPGSELAEKPASEENSPKLQLDPDIFENVNGLDELELKSELQKRNLSQKGSEPDLKVRLAKFLQEERNANSA
jgi:hypothetical protein